MRQLKKRNVICRGRNKITESYFSELSKLERISPEEEANLARMVKEGDLEAKTRLVKANLRFVVSVANQYEWSGVDLADLISEGNLGLIRAAEKFDESKGFKFISYAVWWIRQSILKYILEVKGIRIPANMLGLLRKFYRANNDCLSKEGRQLSVEEFSTEANLIESQLWSLKCSLYNMSSLDSPIDDSKQTMQDYLYGSVGDDSMMEESRDIELRRILDKLLDEREQFVIKRFFGIECDREESYEEIAYQLDLTRERVRQIKEKALKKLSKSKMKLVEFLR